MNIKNWKKGAVLFAVLLFPSLVYVILSSGDHSFISRPVFGPKTLDDSDTVYHQVSKIQYSNCRGEEFDVLSLREKIVVISFYNSKDSVLSSRINGQMMSIQDRFRDNTDVYIVSLGITEDSLSEIKACEIAKDYQSNSGNKWKWAILSKMDADELAQNELFLPTDSLTLEQDFAQVVLLDKKGRIRAYRDGRQYVEIKTLVDDIKIVKAEDFISKKRDNNEGE